MADHAPSLNKNLRTAPHNIDAERALLGATLLKPDVMHDISVTVFPESFYADKHRVIYDAIYQIFLKGDPIDIVSVTNKLTTMNALERVGGAAYIAELIETVPAAGNAQYYADLVQSKSTLRGLIHASEEIAEMAYQNPENTEETIDKAEKTIYQVTNAPTTQKFEQIGRPLKDAWEKFEYLSAHHDERRGVPSGFTGLDNLLGGFQKSDLIILAARPGMGKTTMALDIARNAALLHDAHVGVFSLEMSSQQLVERMLASESGVDSWNLRNGRLKDDSEYAALQDAMAKLDAAPLYIVDEPALNIVKMRSAARRLKNEHGLDMIIVDYLQLMSPTATKASDSMVQQVTEISRSLKILARELNVPVIALSQLSRAVEQRGGKPRLSDLRDSGSIEQDADVVMFIHREDKQNKDQPAERPTLPKCLSKNTVTGRSGVPNSTLTASMYVSSILIPIIRVHTQVVAMMIFRRIRH